MHPLRGGLLVSRGSHPAALCLTRESSHLAECLSRGPSNSVTDPLSSGSARLPPPAPGTQRGSAQGPLQGIARSTREGTRGTVALETQADPHRPAALRAEHAEPPSPDLPMAPLGHVQRTTCSQREPTLLAYLREPRMFARTRLQLPSSLCVPFRLGWTIAATHTVRNHRCSRAPGRRLRRYRRESSAPCRSRRWARLAPARRRARRASERPRRASARRP
jgi:hypothetical protein